MINRVSILLVVLFTISLSYPVKEGYSINSGDLKRDILIISTLPGDVYLDIQDPPTQSRSNKTKASNSTQGSSGTGQGGTGTTPTNQGGTKGEGSTQDSSGINKGEGLGTGTTGGTGTNSEKNYSILELQVEPDRKTIYNGEQTSIQIDLHEIDPEGNEDLNCGGKEVTIQVTGLVDGTISHRSGKITLNEAGVAYIDYMAGQRDKQIRIIATFTPPETYTNENPVTDPTNQVVTSGTSTTDTSPGSPIVDSPGTNQPDQDGTTDNSTTDTSTDSPTGDNPRTNQPDQDGTTDNSTPDTNPDSPTGDNPGTNPPDPDAKPVDGSTELSRGPGTGQGPGTNPTNQSGTSGTVQNDGTPGYPEEVKGEAIINVKPLEYEATLTVKGTYKKTEKSSYRRQTSDGVEDGTYDLQERQEASFYVPLKMENAGDMPVLNQRWEYYRPLDINLSNFKASFRSRQYDHGEGGGYGYRITVTITKSPTGQKVAGKDVLLQSNIVLIIDKKTEKVVKVISAYSVEFKWQGSRTMYGEHWDPDSRSTENDADPIDEDDKFDAEPVEDPVPDPTFSSVSQSLKTYFKDMGIPLPSDVEIPEDEDEKPEICPDYLVTTGDGKTFFGGRGEKIKDHSNGANTDREERTFSWNMTRKKKQL